MQLGDGILPLVLPLGELDETCILFNSGPFAALCENDVISKTGSHCHQRTEPRQHMYRKLGEN